MRRLADRWLEIFVGIAALLLLTFLLAQWHSPTPPVKEGISTGDVAVLTPEGDSGGNGGRVVTGFTTSLAGLLDRSR